MAPLGSMTVPRRLPVICCAAAFQPHRTATRVQISFIPRLMGDPSSTKIRRSGGSQTTCGMCKEIPPQPKCGDYRESCERVNNLKILLRLSEQQGARSGISPAIGTDLDRTRPRFFGRSVKASDAVTVT